MKKFYEFIEKNMVISKTRGGELSQNSKIWKKKGKGKLAQIALILCCVRWVTYNKFVFIQNLMYLKAPVHPHSSR